MNGYSLWLLSLYAQLWAGRRFVMVTIGFVGVAVFVPRGSFFSPCGGLQPSAATVGPLGPSLVFFWGEIFLAVGSWRWQVAGGSQ